MSLVSTFASALPRQVLFPAPRRSEAERQFDALMQQLEELQPAGATPLHDASLTVVRTPWEGPARDVLRRARD